MGHHQIELSNLTLAYQDSGEGEAIVLLHGFCGSHEYWDKVIPALSETNRVIVPDLPGHGDSTFPKGNYGMEYMADTLVELLDQLELEKVTLFGTEVSRRIDFVRPVRIEPADDGAGEEGARGGVG